MEDGQQVRGFLLDERLHHSAERHVVEILARLRCGEQDERVRDVRGEHNCLVAVRPRVLAAHNRAVPGLAQVSCDDDQNSLGDG